MGLYLVKLIIYILQIFKLVGDATIWLFKKLFLALFVSIKLSAKVLQIPFIITRIVFRSIGSVFQSVGNYLRSFKFPALTYKKKPAAHAIGHKYQTMFSSAKYFFLGFVFASLILGSFSIYYVISKDLPHPQLLTKRDIPLTTKIYDRNNELLYEIYADQNRTSITLDDLPDYFINATIAIEDQEFYRHQGFSPRGIVRAAYNIIIHDELQGGSTITQQLVRSALLTRNVSITRKLQELILSVWTEQLYTKEEILTMYFNQVPYGGTAWGAETGAQTYFGKSIRDVTLSEAALLAGLPAAPTTFSPFGSRPKLAKLRQKDVLRRMEEEGFITRKEQEQAETEELSYSYSTPGIRAPHFVMYVRQVLNQRYGPRMVEQGGLIVYTTLDLSIQDEVQNIVTSKVSELNNLNVGNGAAVVVDPQNGQILAMVGSTDYFDIDNDGNVNVSLTPQQPGSTIKVVTYTAALQNGYTAASLINDSPITYTAQGSNPYSPVNYDGKFHGITPLRNALGNSFNIPAVRVLSKIGLPKMIEQGQKMGIDSWNNPDNYGLSLTLGGADVTMLDMAEVYATLANSGTHYELTPIVRITDYLGNDLNYHKNRKPNQAVPEDTAFIISDILADNKARTTAFGPNSDLNIPNSWVAVKTGTSNEKRDNWAIGYTKDFVVVTWVGNNDNSPMSNIASGVTGATPVWRSITEMLLKRYPSQKPLVPPTIVAVPCRGQTEYFIRGTEPIGGCRPIPKPSLTPNETDKEKLEEV